MTCYLAATRRWITRTKLTPPPPPHAGPSENNAILEDQLKTHRRWQTQTSKKKKKRRQTHTDLNILRGHAAPTATPSAACRPVNMLLFFYTLLRDTEAPTQPRTHKRILPEHKTHIAGALFVCVLFFELPARRGHQTAKSCR